MFRITSTLAVALCVLTGGAAYATKPMDKSAMDESAMDKSAMDKGAMEKKGMGSDEMAFSSAKTSISQAISAAEQRAGGKASMAEFDMGKDNKPVYNVEIVAGSKVIDVVVDANTGVVISTKEEDESAEKENESNEYN